VLGGSTRTTVALDDDLVRIAQEFTGITEKKALIREALKALIERESHRRLASLGGTMPELKNIPGRRAQVEARDLGLINKAADELNAEVEDVLRYQETLE
jgi:Arc/MetJ family transcription regulator